MCGIAGIISSNPNDVNADRIKHMTDAIAHRGPDGEGAWVSEHGHVGLGHRRLSILDLSHDGDQPMHYLDRYTIVFNGEIYNYIELKKVLLKQGYQFKSETDTEVLMALFDRDKENCLSLLDGMFAFAIYDKVTNKVFCARDRFGEKPFFYSYKKGVHFLFGSEMKCLWQGSIPKEVNNLMLFNYINFNFSYNPNETSSTFYDHCTRLPHSHYLWLDVATLELDLQQYYHLDYKHIDSNITEAQAIERFYQLMETSIKRRLRSDVPVGSSLSGGLDSSIIVSMIHRLNPQVDQKTFSAVFPGFKKDERKYMDYVIQRTHADARFVTPNEIELIDDIKKLVYHQEEPFSSASIYAQYCVMGLAKKNNVTVLLDGQGADETLAGYHPYYIHYFKELSKTNKALYKKEKAAYLTMHSGSSINPLVTQGPKYIVKNFLAGHVNELKIIRSRLQQLRNPLMTKAFFNEHIGKTIRLNHRFESLNHSLYESTMVFGLQELLRYVDRNSMAHSREVRLPFLYHELVEFIFSLPANLKIKEGWTKYIARKTFEGVLPPEIAWRTDKIGYEPPQKEWLRNKKIVDYTQHKMNLLVQQGILNKSAIDRALASNQQQDDMSESKWRYFMAGSLFDE